jgi:hypothetical protein
MWYQILFAANSNDNILHQWYWRNVLIEIEITRETEGRKYEKNQN